MKTIHILKVFASNWDKYLENTSWSIRRDDRNFRRGDLCIFQELYPFRPLQTKEVLIIKEITKILDHNSFKEGLNKGYVILDLKLIEIISLK